MAEVSVTTERDEEGVSHTAIMTGFTVSGFDSLRLLVGLLELQMGGRHPKATMSALADAEWLEGFADDMERDTDDGKAHWDPAVLARLRSIAAVLRDATPVSEPPPIAVAPPEGTEEPR